MHLNKGYPRKKHCFVTKVNHCSLHIHPYSWPTKQKINTTIESSAKKGMWTDEVLKTIMDVIENGTHSMKKANKSWNIPMSSFTNHLNGKTKSKKMGPRVVLTKEENAIVITWTLSIQECGPSINLQQLKIKVTKITKARVTPF